MSAYIAPELRSRVRDFFDDCCAYCHTAERLTVVTFEIEHIQPISIGGATAFENMCLACPMCNRHKADRTAAIDPKSGVVVELFHPQRDQWADHFAWNEDFSEITGLTAQGRATIAALLMNRQNRLSACGAYGQLLASIRRPSIASTSGQTGPRQQSPHFRPDRTGAVQYSGPPEKI